jgi:hypothetical protein
LQEPKTYRLTARYGVKGRLHRRLLTVPCTTLQDIIVQGERHIPEFHNRNPWISIDSRYRVAVVVVDPIRRLKAAQLKMRHATTGEQAQ